MQKNLLKYVLIIVATLVIILIILKIATDSIKAPGVEDSTRNQANPTSQQEDTTKTQIPTAQASEEATAKGMYVDYTAEVLAAALEKKRVLFFYANWCPSCRQQDTNLQLSAAQIPPGLAIFKVDYDSETGLRQKYGVTLQHTFVLIDENGNELKQWNTLYSAYDLQSIIEQVS